MYGRNADLLDHSCKPPHWLKVSQKELNGYTNYSAQIQTQTLKTVYSGTPFYSGPLGTTKDCPDYEGVLISGLDNVLWESIKNHLDPVACVHNRGVSAQFRGLD